MTKRIFKKTGAKRISENAQIKAGKLIEEYSFKIAKQAIKNAEYFGRKTIREEDIKI